MSKPILTPQIREILELARRRAAQRNELGYRSIAKASSEFRFNLGVDENGRDRYLRACLLVEIAAGSQKNPANLYDLDKDGLIKAIDKALNRGKVK